MAASALQHLSTCQSQDGTKQNESELLVCRFARPSIFPVTLHKMLQDAEQNDFQDIVSWSSTGGSFKVHKPLEFVDKVMPEYFNVQTKYKSFQRQLNLYGFTRIHQGTNKGSYAHKLFRCQDPSPHALLVRHSMPTSTKKFQADTCALTGARRTSFDSNSLVMSAFDMQALMDNDANGPKGTIDESPERVDDLFPTLKLPRLEDFCFESGEVAMCTPRPDLIGDINEKETSNITFNSEQRDSRKKAQNGQSFPFMLHDMLSDDTESNNFAHIVSWDSDGMSFKVHKQDEFVQHILPLYFDQSKYGSFRRQLNHYSFSRAKGGKNKGRYSHVSFVKGARSMCKHIRIGQPDSN